MTEEQPAIVESKEQGVMRSAVVWGSRSTAVAAAELLERLASAVYIREDEPDSVRHSIRTLRLIERVAFDHRMVLQGLMGDATRSVSRRASFEDPDEEAGAAPQSMMNSETFGAQALMQLMPLLKQTLGLSTPEPTPAPQPPLQGVRVLDSGSVNTYELRNLLDALRLAKDCGEEDLAKQLRERIDQLMKPREGGAE